MAVVMPPDVLAQVPGPLPPEVCVDGKYRSICHHKHPQCWCEPRWSCPRSSGWGSHSGVESRSLQGGPIGFPAVRDDRRSRFDVGLYNRLECLSITPIIGQGHQEIRGFPADSSKIPLPLHKSGSVALAPSKLWFVDLHCTVVLGLPMGVGIGADDFPPPRHKPPYNSPEYNSHSRSLCWSADSYRRSRFPLRRSTSPGQRWRRWSWPQNGMKGGDSSKGTGVLAQIKCHVVGAPDSHHAVCKHACCTQTGAQSGDGSSSLYVQYTPCRGDCRTWGKLKSWVVASSPGRTWPSRLRLKAAAWPKRNRFGPGFLPLRLDGGFLPTSLSLSPSESDADGGGSCLSRKKGNTRT